MTAPRESLTLALLQAREACMAFFRPSLNKHGLTEQQWRVIRILHNAKELESSILAKKACILKPSMTGVLARLERNNLIIKRKSKLDARCWLVSLTWQGQQCFDDMAEDMALNYDRLTTKFGAKKFNSLMKLLEELKTVNP